MFGKTRQIPVLVVVYMYVGGQADPVVKLPPTKCVFISDSFYAVQAENTPRTCSLDPPISGEQVFFIGTYQRWPRKGAFDPRLRICIELTDAHHRTTPLNCECYQDKGTKPTGTEEDCERSHTAREWQLRYVRLDIFDVS